MPIDVAKGRLTQIFGFLKELNELRNPVPRDISGHAKLLWLNEWPTHPFIEVRRGDRKEEDDGDDKAELEPLIRVRRADLTPYPKPPEALIGGVRGVYNRAEYATQRQEMLQFWADYIEQLTTTGQVNLGRFKQVA